MADTPEELAHWKSVIKAFDGYMQYHLSANNARRMAFLSLPRESRDLIEVIGYREKLEAVDEGIRRNAEFIDEIIQDPVFADMLGTPDSHAQDHTHGHSHDPRHDHDHGHDHGSHSNSNSHSTATHPTAAPSTNTHSHNQPHSHSHAPAPAATSPLTQGERDLAQDKVRSTLRSFVRDWAVEGEKERTQCYTPILEALERAYPSREGRGDIKVLVPGCGLGRLAMEIAARGFFSQGNEFSTYMLLASHFALNQTTHPHSHTIFPYLHSFSNHLTTESHLLRSITVPDVVPADILAPSADGVPGAFSLVAGDFEEVYGPTHWDTGVPGSDEDGDADQKGRWGAVVTCFFIDTARNVLNYLRIIHGLLADDGVWINLGPLLWHFENSPTHSAKGEGSIELSLDEVKELARHVGFEIKVEKIIRTTYTGVPDGMLEHVYQASFWTATKLRT